ncbi:hypothetical protein AB0K08_02925 [Citricoccus sp. NPDC055426]
MVQGGFSGSVLRWVLQGRRAFDSGAAPLRDYQAGSSGPAQY